MINKENSRRRPFSELDIASERREKADRTLKRIRNGFLLTLGGFLFGTLFGHQITYKERPEIKRTSPYSLKQKSESVFPQRTYWLTEKYDINGDGHLSKGEHNQILKCSRGIDLDKPYVLEEPYIDKNE